MLRRFSVAALVALLAVAASPVAAIINDLECHSGNVQEDTGVCADPFSPTWNKPPPYDGTSFETDSLRILDVNVRSTINPDNQVDGLVNVHRITFGDSTVDGSGSNGGNTPRNITSPATYGVLPAGYLRYPMQLAYTADGVFLDPRPDELSVNTPGQDVASLTATFVYTLKTTAAFDQPTLYHQLDGSVQVWTLYQPQNGFGYTAGYTYVAGQTLQSICNGSSAFGVSLLPNRGIGTYFLTRRVVTTAGGESITGNMTIATSPLGQVQSVQSVGGSQAPANTYTVTAPNVFDAPVLSGVQTPTVGGAFLSFSLNSVPASAPAGKVFISQAVLTLASVSPDSATTAVPVTGTYILDVTNAPTPSVPFVAGSQKAYFKPTGTSTWQQVSASAFANNQVSADLGSVSAPTVASLDLAVMADMPVSSSSSSSSSSTGESSSSSSSSTAPSSSSSSSTAPSSSSSSSTASSSSAVPSSSTASSSSSSTGVRSSSSSSSVAPIVRSSSSSSTGVASSSSAGFSSSSSTGEEQDINGSAVSVSASGIAMVLAAAAVMYA